ncbi:MAG: HAD hydrolase-like protein [Spirochaetales bacterium]|uniref:phosphoglycolate phosphatase n=1 Tax=Candidatus Thalassospirochaeta sargassi TaxID=3119039 RepID=A0AAJ1MNS1_9SPIO|nr:HAD hydrolase-like protein [Spirochaetales bacterium]
MNTLIIFDLDGTIADTREDLVHAVNLVRKSYNLDKLPFDEIIGYVGEGLGPLMHKSLKNNPEIDHNDSCNRFTKYYNENLTVNTCLYDGVEKTIAALSENGFHMAVLSNKPAEMTRKIVTHFGLDKYLITTMGGGDVSTKKPEPEGVFEVIRRAEAKGFKQTKENVWMVGDHHTDMKVAGNAGIKSIFCNYGFGNRQGLPSDFDIETFSDVKNIITG